MVKRMLDCRASDFKKMTGQDIKKAIRASEGRVIVSETMSGVPSLYPSVTNAELAASFGADILLLNLFDVFHPEIQGYDHEADETIIQEIKEKTGRPIGLNLEPVDLKAKEIEKLDALTEGRIASTASLKKAKELGFDFVCLTGNPKTGVSNDATVSAIKEARKVFGEDGLIIAGKMHGAGVEDETGSGIISNVAVEQFIEAGADIILMPAPGTIPGITVNRLEEYIRYVHEKGALALLSIGTSQEGADEQTIRQIALNSKMVGADLYHLGDTGYYGIAVPENIMTYSIAVRGRRHTYVRMAASINR